MSQVYLYAKHGLIKSTQTFFDWDYVVSAHWEKTNKQATGIRVYFMTKGLDIILVEAKPL